jgi:site-specific recombinase XerD
VSEGVVTIQYDGDLETAQYVVRHASVNTTRIYNHCDQKVAQEEIERIKI